MKKIIAILCAAFALAACTETLITDSADRLPAVEETTSDGDIKLNLTITRTDAFDGEATGTKAIKTGWNAGDVIMVFIQNTAPHKYLELKYNGLKWVGTYKNGLTEDEIKNALQKKLRAVHLPYNSHLVPSSAFPTFNFLGYYDYFLATGIVDYTYDSKQGLTTKLRLETPDYSASGRLIDFRVTGFEKSRTYYMNMKYLRHFGAVYVYPNNYLNMLCDVYALDQERLILGRKDGNDLHFTGILDASAVGTPVTFDFTILDRNNKIAYTRSVGPKTVNGNLSVDLGDISDESKWKATQYEDLGINNADGKRIYWSKYNLGASATYPYGYYFSYGQVQGYPIQGTFGNYTCEHNFYQQIPSDFPDGRLDSNDCLIPEYDAAHAALGGAWRIPTTDEMKQLYENTNKAAVAADSESAGITYTSIKSGYGDKSVFLPAAGSVYQQTPGGQGQTLLYRTSNYYYRASGDAVFNFWVKVASPDKYSWDITQHHTGRISPKGLPIRPVFTLQ